MVHGCDVYVYYGFEISKEDCQKVLYIIDPQYNIDIHSIYHKKNI